jgi:hypothetical protein
MPRATSSFTISIAVEKINAPEYAVVEPGVEKCLCRGLSRVRRKKHARFLGGWARATASGYPARRIGRSSSPPCGRRRLRRSRARYGTMILPILILVARSVTSNWWHAATYLALTPITLLPAHCRIGALFGRAGAPLPALFTSTRGSVWGYVIIIRRESISMHWCQARRVGRWKVNVA